MAATDYKTLSELLYYGRCQYFGHMKEVANDAIARYGDDPVLIFFRAFASLLDFNIQEAIRDLETIKNEENVELCTLMALIVAYKEQTHSDREAVAAFDEKLKEKRKVASANSLRFAGLFLALSSRPDKALQYADRMIKIDQNCFEGYVLRGWTYLMDSQINSEKADELRRKAEKDFESAEALTHEPGNELEMLLGKSKCYELKGDTQKALQTLVTIRQANFIPKMNELLRLELALGKWESAYQSATELHSEIEGKENLFALNCIILYRLAYEGNYTEAGNDLRSFFDLLQRKEPQNVNLYIVHCRLFSSMCGRNMLVLRQTNATMHSVVTSFERTSINLLEYGNQMLLAASSKEDLEAASKVMIKAVEADPDNTRAMLAFNMCKVLLEKTKEFDKIYRELDMLKETMTTTVTKEDMAFLAELLYVQALILQSKNKIDEVPIVLRKAVEYLQSSVPKVPMSPEYLLALNADLRLSIVKCLIRCFPPEPLVPGKQPPAAMSFAKNVLDTVVNAVPGLIEAKFHLAKIKYLAGDLEAACVILQDSIEKTKEADMSDAHLLLALILVEMDQFSKAEQSLSTALSLNFSIRSTPGYHVIKAKIQSRSGDTAGCRKTLESAIALPGVRKVTARQGSAGGSKESGALITESDRLSIFLQLSEALRKEGNIHEATKIMTDAMNEFRGTSEESRVMIANADLDLSRGDSESALTSLKKIEPSKPCYVQAREKMAEIYLNHRHDRKSFAQCYKELVEKQPNVRTKMLLGDAYMNILEIDKAIVVYQSAYKENQNDVGLIKKIAQAFVKMHYYTQAIAYYKSAYKKDPSIKHELISLLIRLHQYDEALKLLDETEPQEQTYDLSRLMENSRNFMARATIAKAKKNMNEYEQMLRKAQVQQREVLRRVKVEQPEGFAEQIEFAMQIVNRLAEYSIDQGNLKEAVELYQRASKFRENDTKLQMKIIKLHMQMGNLDECESQCVNLIKADLDNNEAVSMMAELMLAKNDLEEAQRYYNKMVEKKPDDFHALHQAIRCYRFKGDLESAAKLLENAKSYSSRAILEPGFAFCNGYYSMHMGNANEALKELNKCRKDSEWGLLSLRHMVEICLNPHHTILGAEAFEDISGEKGVDDTMSVSLRTADKLLAELKALKDSSDYGILDAHLSLATKHVSDAMNKFQALASQRPVAASLGIATGHMLKKNQDAARKELKKILKDSTWSLEDSEWFERAFLLYADLAIQAGKIDIAGETLEQCLQYNKSCAKAYEYLGLLHEKEQRYVEACLNYEQAWKHCHHSDPAIGYKLAFNYLKAKRFIEAIEVSQAVLKENPNYPKIKKEILEKARSSFRA